MADNPVALFDAWYAEAKAAEINDPDAMALATATSDGKPSVRMVLLKGYGPEGFTFYTNADSRKGGELEANPQASLLFHWKSLRRQVRVEGAIEEVGAEEADAYFATRSRDSQIGAHASDQSRPLASRGEFLARIAKVTARYLVGAVPRPPRWTGFRVKPERIEFWTDRPHRLHERRLFVRDGDGWTEGLLYP
jgi:pyridoxamine 5'-phosphate oxidase